MISKKSFTKDYWINAQKINYMRIRAMSHLKIKAA